MNFFNKLLLALAGFGLCCCGMVQAQEELQDDPLLKLRHIKGMMGIDAVYGWANFGTFYEVGFSNDFSNKLIGRVGINYEEGKIVTSEYKASRLLAECIYTFGDLGEIAYFNIAMGGFGGYELAQNDEMNISENSFIYGLRGGAVVEIFITNRLVLLIQGFQYATIKSKFGSLHYQIGGGLRFLIN